MFYFIIFSIILFFAAHDYDRQMNKYTSDIIYFWLFLIFWLVAGLKYETGVDWPGYTEFFNNSESIKEVINKASYSFFKTEFEFGYVLLNSIVKTFTDNAQWLFLLIAFITNLMLFSSLKKYSKHIFVSLLIYYGTTYFILDMSGIRQCISLNLFLISLQYILERHFLKYLLVIIIASLFHISSLFLIPMYFVMGKEYKSWLLILIISVGIIISLFQIAWVTLFLEKIIDSFYIKAITGKLSRLSDREDSRNFGIGFLFNGAVFVFCILNRKKLSENKMFNLFLNMYVINLFFYYFIWELTEISSRFRLYFAVGDIVLFTYFLDIYKNRIKKLVVFIFIISFSIFYGRPYLFEMQDGIAYNPYQNYIIQEVFNIKSSGKERNQKFSNSRE